MYRVDNSLSGSTTPGNATLTRQTTTPAAPNARQCAAAPTWSDLSRPRLRLYRALSKQVHEGGNKTPAGSTTGTGLSTKISAWSWLGIVSRQVQYEPNQGVMVVVAPPLTVTALDLGSGGQVRLDTIIGVLASQPVRPPKDLCKYANLPG